MSYTNIIIAAWVKYYFMMNRKFLIPDVSQIYSFIGTLSICNIFEMNSIPRVGWWDPLNSFFIKSNKRQDFPTVESPIMT